MDEQLHMFSRMDAKNRLIIVFIMKYLSLLNKICRTFFLYVDNLQRITYIHIIHLLVIKIYKGHLGLQKSEKIK